MGINTARKRLIQEAGEMERRSGHATGYQVPEKMDASRSLNEYPGDNRRVRRKLAKLRRLQPGVW